MYIPNDKIFCCENKFLIFKSKYSIKINNADFCCLFKQLLKNFIEMHFLVIMTMTSVMLLQLKFICLLL